MWTTNPELASMLANPEDGYKYVEGSTEKVHWKCITCNKLYKSKSIEMVNKNGLSCSNCSDGVSYSEKVMSNILKYICVDFGNNITFYWSDAKRYDFYIPSLNMIIETHGGQHYEKGFESIGGRTLQEEQENDKYKYEMAMKNGIDKYIVIDCRKSELEWIKNSILSSELSSIFNLSVLNWNEIHMKSSKSLHVKILEMWNNGYDKQDISAETSMSMATINNVLNKYDTIGLCKHSKLEDEPLVQLDLKGNLIKEWDTIRQACNELSIDMIYITRVCKGIRKSSKGFKWKFKNENVSWR